MRNRHRNLATQLSEEEPPEGNGSNCSNRASPAYGNDSAGPAVDVNRYSCAYTPARSLGRIEADRQAIGNDMVSMLRELAG
jgi:hypothetical protein